MSGRHTKKVEDQEMRARYDFSKAVRGKYAARYQKGTNVVVLAQDVAAAFKTSAAVNKALRQLVVQRRASRVAQVRPRARRSR